ncbi:hypothetical protein ACFL11_01175 [Patescibacteria group bacterium]
MAYVIVIIDLQNLAEYLNSKAHTLVPIIISALAGVEKRVGNPLIEIITSSLLPQPAVQNIREVTEACIFIKPSQGVAGGRDTVDEEVKKRIAYHTGHPEVSLILMISGDQDFIPSIERAKQQGKTAVLISPKEIIDILTKGGGDSIDLISRNLQKTLELKRNPFPNLVIKLQSQQESPFTASEEEMVEFMRIVIDALIRLSKEEKLSSNIEETGRMIWEIISPWVRKQDKQHGKKFTFYDCQQVVVALSLYSDVLSEQERMVTFDLESPLLSLIRQSL